MDTNSRQRDPREDATTPQFDEYVSYEDDVGTVICDRRNPAAWIRSTAAWRCHR